jgi:hypothetical protein
MDRRSRLPVRCPVFHQAVTSWCIPRSSPHSLPQSEFSEWRKGIPSPGGRFPSRWGKSSHLAGAELIMSPTAGPSTRVATSSTAKSRRVRVRSGSAYGLDWPTAGRQPRPPAGRRQDPAELRSAGASLTSTSRPILSPNLRHWEQSRAPTPPRAFLKVGATFRSHPGNL